MANPSTTKTYPSDLRDEEWTILDPLIPRARKAGRPEKYSKRAILNAIFYLVRSGCAWRMLPNDLPPWKLVWHYFAHWKKQGVWAQLNDALRRMIPDGCCGGRHRRRHVVTSFDPLGAATARIMLRR